MLFCCPVPLHFRFRDCINCKYNPLLDQITFHPVPTSQPLLSTVLFNGGTIRVCFVKVAGILTSMIDSRRVDNKALLELAQEEYGELCFSSVIQRKAATGRISIHGFVDNPEIKQATGQYKDFVEELLRRV